MQARFYDPIASRFLSTDPIGYQDQLNLYAYVHNDPVNAVDPTGMQSDPLANAVAERNEAISMGNDTALGSAMSSGMRGSDFSTLNDIGKSIPAPSVGVCVAACSFASDVSAGASSIPGVNALASMAGVKTVAAGVEGNGTFLLGPNVQSGVYATTDGSQAGLVNTVAGSAGLDVSTGGFIAASNGNPPQNGGFGEMTVFASGGYGGVSGTVDVGTKSGSVTGSLSATASPIPASFKGGVAVTHFTPCQCK